MHFSWVMKFLPNGKRQPAHPPNETRLRITPEYDFVTCYQIARSSVSDSESLYMHAMLSHFYGGVLSWVKVWYADPLPSGWPQNHPFCPPLLHMFPFLAFGHVHCEEPYFKKSGASVWISDDQTESEVTAQKIIVTCHRDIHIEGSGFQVWRIHC